MVGLVGNQRSLKQQSAISATSRRFVDGSNENGDPQRAEALEAEYCCFPYSRDLSSASDGGLRERCWAAGPR